LEPLLEDEAISLLQVVTGGPVPPIVAQAVLQAVADLPLGVRLAVEPLNRFECYFLNTAAACAALVSSKRRGMRGRFIVGV
jgi:hypothetical protein